MNYQELIKKNPHLFSNQNSPIEIITDPTTISRWQEEASLQGDKEIEYPDQVKIGIVFEDSHYLVLRDLLHFPDGSLKGVLRIINKGDLALGNGVVVMPILNQRIVLLEHYRTGTRQIHLEFPRGFGEGSITPEAQAIQEIEEEIGGKIKEIFPIGFMFNNTGLEGNKVFLFLARLSEVGKPQKEEGIQKIVYKTKPEFESLLRAGEITDGFTISTYAMAKAKKLF